METFIAFFDILGFKEIIDNNSLAEVKVYFEHLVRDSQTAMSNNKWVKPNGRMPFPDLSKQKVNCLHISDSILFWTNGNSNEDFIDLVEVCSSFYLLSIQGTFPLRGCLTFGEIDFKPLTLNRNINEVMFYNYSIFGKGLVEAYLKAESLEFAGCLLDKRAISKVSDKLISDLIQDKKICKYKVPFKAGLNEEYVFRPLNNDIITVKRLEALFTFASKAQIAKMPDKVKNKFNNTKEFIDSCMESDTNNLETCNT